VSLKEVSVGRKKSSYVPVLPSILTSFRCAGEMAEDELFSEGDVDNESALFHPSTSYESGRRAESSYSDSDSSFHESYFLDHNYVSDVPTSSANKRKR
jgi:hypothetical protein